MTKRSCWVPLALAVICGCDSSGLTNRSVEAFCARVSACGVSQDEDMSFGECVQLVNLLELGLSRGTITTTTDRMTKAAYECIRDAATCDEMVACSRPTSAQLALCDSAKDDLCSGDVLVSCSHERERISTQDCGKAGLVCGVGESGAWCGLAACDPAKTPPRCEGDTLFTCDRQGNVLVNRDCSNEGQACGKKKDGTLGCVGTVACDVLEDRMHCEGSVMVSCREGSESRHDCRELGADWTCEAKTETTEYGSESTMSCVPVAKECTIGVGETCSKGVIGYCHAGHPASYDCRSAGLSGCATKGNTASCVK